MNKTKSMPIIFFDIEVFVYNELALAGQAVSSTYYDALRLLRENEGRIRPELWRQKNWLLHTNNAPFHTSFFTRKFFTKNNMTVGPHPPHFSLFLRLKVKLKRRHFDTTEVIEAESQAMLNTLTEHDFQDTEALETENTPERGLLDGDSSQ
jgi:hypothetical protein